MKLRPKLTSMKAIDYLCLEGAFAMAFDAWMGTSYLAGLAGEMHADVLFVTLLTSLPWIGSAGQLLSLHFVGRAESLKRYTITLAWIGRTLWFIPVLLALIWGIQSYRDRTPFPATAWFTTVALVAFPAALIGNASGLAWNSWMRAVIPGNFRARFFGLKQRYIMFTLVCANLFAALIINWKVRDLHVGFFVLAVLAVFSAMTSTILLSKAPDAHVSPVVSATRSTPIWVPFIDPKFRRVMVFGAIFNGAVFFCAPYFAYFYTRELHFSLGTVAAWTVIANLGNFLAATFWAKRIDNPNGLMPTLFITGHLVAMAPLFYVLPSAEIVVYIAPFEFFLNGIAWSGYGIANSTLLFRSCPEGKNTVYFAAYSAMSGLAGAVGVVAGGQLAHALAAYGGFRALWLIGATLRFAAIWMLLPGVEEKVPASASDISSYNESRTPARS